MESLRQALGAVYYALAEAAGGDKVLDRANEILADSVSSGAIRDAYACAAVMSLIHASRPEGGSKRKRSRRTVA